MYTNSVRSSSSLMNGLRAAFAKAEFERTLCCWLNLTNFTQHAVFIVQRSTFNFYRPRLTSLASALPAHLHKSHLDTGGCWMEEPHSKTTSSPIAKSRSTTTTSLVVPLPATSHPPSSTPLTSDDGGHHSIGWTNNAPRQTTGDGAAAEGNYRWSQCWHPHHVAADSHLHPRAQLVRWSLRHLDTTIITSSLLFFLAVRPSSPMRDVGWFSCLGLRLSATITTGQPAPRTTAWTTTRQPLDADTDVDDDEVDAPPPNDNKTELGGRTNKGRSVQWEMHEADKDNDDKDQDVDVDVEDKVMRETTVTRTQRHDPWATWMTAMWMTAAWDDGGEDDSGKDDGGEDDK
ncbi:hypothetical protein BJ912DRAFT_1140065 [Pholiota molesta]|nr:hypothetical protein BJ912DRAFT_1140065 [Pholiota molesta]